MSPPATNGPRPAHLAIPALTPEHDGHQFVFYGDCCSGIADGKHEATFARVNNALRALQPRPQFVLFLGDHIAGKPDDADSLRSQWRHWLDVEMAWLTTERVPRYHITSNHDTADATAERVWREVFADIPGNGPPEQTGLSYWVRREDLLLVAVNTNYSGLGGAGHVECKWLETTLRDHADARFKIVAGHHPAFPVNGYDQRPAWCIEQHEADELWAVLARHGVLAYLCSHVIAFDVQSHAGVLQICSGGAGTKAGPGGFMGEGQYHHLVQAALDDRGFRLQTIDDAARIRARHEWPST